MKKRSKLSIFILMFLMVFVFYPLIMMLVRVRWSEFGTLITSSSFKESLSNSLFVTSIATILSVGIAYILAFALNRTNIRHRELLKLCLTIPMLIPSISHGLGLINLFGNNGIISSIFGFNIVGSTGIIIGSIIYSCPVAFLMFCDGFNYVDVNMYDSAKVLGLNKWQTFKKITLCYLKKPILSAIFAVFTMIFTDYGVPLAVGGNFITLPVFLYKEVIGLLDFSKGTMIGLFLLIPAFVSFAFDTFSKDFTTSDNNKKFKIEDNKTRDTILGIFVYLIIIFIVLINGSFIYYAFIDNVVLDKSLTLKHFNYVIDNGVIKYILNSVIIAIGVSVVGSFLAYFCAYITARGNEKKNKIIHILAISSLAIPGIVLGLSYIVSFKNTFLYNTYLILIIVNIVHFFASPYLMAYNALKKVNPNYEDVAKTLNISKFKIIKDVIVPITKPTIREMIAYFFVNATVTISAVTFLFNTKTMPLSLLINNYEGSFMLGEAAIISLILLIINVIIKTYVYLINRRDYRRREKNEVNV